LLSRRSKTRLHARRGFASNGYGTRNEQQGLGSTVSQSRRIHQNRAVTATRITSSPSGSGRPILPPAGRERESATSAARRRRHLASVRRRASARTDPQEPERCRRASGRSRRRRPRRGRDVRQSTLRSDGRLCSRLRRLVYFWDVESGVNCTRASLRIKRSEGRRLVHIRVMRPIWKGVGGNKFCLSDLPQDLHRSFTGFQQPST
jgi:hypothetical protein